MATNDKYDRQIRLWGPVGQRNLSASHVLLVQADAVGAEILKNLVLPGIGAFTILDDHRVGADDLGNNFFVTVDSVGKPRAEVVCELLCEMNPDVTGSARVGNFQNLLQTEPEYFSRFNLVIVANIPRYQVEPLANYCWDNYVPLICIRSLGFLGSIHLQAREHFIAEARGDSERHDLRISSAFEGLRELVNEVLPLNTRLLLQSSDSAEVTGEENAEAKHSDGEKVLVYDSHEYSHIPYPLILVRALSTWQQQAGEVRLPKTTAEKEALRRIVKSFELVSGQRNVEEAVKELRRCWEAPLNDALLWTQQMDEDLVGEGAENEDADSDEGLTTQERLWRFIRQSLLGSEAFSQPSTRRHRFLLRALCEFVRVQGRLPLAPQLPDFTATSQLYARLQHVYYQQSLQDRAQFDCVLDTLLSQHACDRHTLGLSEEDVQSLCRGAASVGMLCTPPLFVSSSSLHHGHNVNENGNINSSNTVRGGGLRSAVEELVETHETQQQQLRDTAEEEAGEDLRQSPVLWLLTLEAAERFYARHFRHPGESSQLSQLSNLLERDELLLVEEMKGLCSDLQLPQSLFTGNNTVTTAMDVDHSANNANNSTSSHTDNSDGCLLGRAQAQEIVRYGGAQLHNVSSLLGGVAAQEAVKLATQIFVPLDNVFVVNGVAGLAASYRL